MDLTTCACWLTLSMFSQHLDPNGMNQTNPGIGVEVNNWVAGEYYNSFKRTSVYFGREFGLSQGMFREGIGLGAVSGYQRKIVVTGSQPIYGLTENGVRQIGTETYYRTTGNSPNYLSPMFAPFFAIEGRHVGANIVFLPNPGEWKQSAFGFQLKFRM